MVAIAGGRLSLFSYPALWFLLVIVVVVPLDDDDTLFLVTTVATSFSFLNAAAEYLWPAEGDFIVVVDIQ